MTWCVEKKIREGGAAHPPKWQGYYCDGQVFGFSLFATPPLSPSLASSPATPKKKRKAGQC